MVQMPRTTATTTTGLPAIDVTVAAGLFQGCLPPNTLTHFAIITGWDQYNSTLAKYDALLGPGYAVPYQISGGKDSNGTYLGKRLLGRTKLAFKNLTEYSTGQMQVEILAGDPDQPSWWRDVYHQRGFEIRHMGYMLAESIWPVVERCEAAGLGNAVQWGHWGVMDKPGSGCYVYMDSQKTLGVTFEILAKENDCDSLLAAPDEGEAFVAMV